MKTGLKIPAGVALFAVLALAGLMGVFAFNAAPQVAAQTPPTDAWTRVRGLIGKGFAASLTQRMTRARWAD